MTLALLQHYGLLDGWLVSRPAMQAYLLEVEARYLANPYHNALHAADVTQVWQTRTAWLPCCTRFACGLTCTPCLTCLTSHFRWLAVALLLGSLFPAYPSSVRRPAAG